MDNSPNEQELEALDNGADPRDILQRRVDAARAERDQALAGLRAVMTDEELLDEFGIDLTQLRQ